MFTPLPQELWTARKGRFFRQGKSWNAGGSCASATPTPELDEGATLPGSAAPVEIMAEAKKVTRMSTKDGKRRKLESDHATGQE